MDVKPVEVPPGLEKPVAQKATTKTEGSKRTTITTATAKPGERLLNTADLEQIATLHDLNQKLKTMLANKNAQEANQIRGKVIADWNKQHPNQPRLPDFAKGNAAPSSPSGK